MNLLDLIDVLFHIYHLTKEHLMATDYAGILALSLFAGGLFFWFMVSVMAIVAVYRGVCWLFGFFRNPSRHVGSVPQSKR